MYVRRCREFISDTAANGAMSARYRSTRRTALRAFGSLGVASIATAAAASAESDASESADDSTRSRPADGCESSAVNRYVAAVDRIVDGRYVVLLLEAGGDVVDQRVVPRSRLEAVDEGDVLLVVIDDGSLLVARHLPKRPGQSRTESSPEDRFDSLVTDDAE